jgi:hypothetical protein
MALAPIPWHPTDRMLRQFAAAWLAAVGFLAWRVSGTAGTVLAVLAVGVGVAGLIRPRLVRWLFLGLTLLTLPIGWVVSNLVLALLFYGIFTPLGLVFRLMGRDALGLKPRPGCDSYWVPRAAPANVERYFRQF